MRKNRPVIIYGAGVRGGEVFHTLIESNVHVEAFCDRDADNIPMRWGMEVLTLEEALGRYYYLPFVVAIKNKDEGEKIRDWLREEGMDSYLDIDEFFQGTNDVVMETVSCGLVQGYRIVPYLLEKNEKTVAYCFGVGKDFSFEKELAQRYQTDVYLFDPSPEVVEEMKKQSLPEMMKFYAFGLSDEDTEKVFHKPRYGQNYSEYYAIFTSAEEIRVRTYRLSSLMEMMGHTHLDLLKMDIEGSEFKVIPDILKAGISIGQICLETHSRLFPDSVEKARGIKEMLNSHGYMMIHNDILEQTYIHKKYL
ncbi:MAG: FkbM family methyltransferase [Lachnospiraceae bacterium]|nr:FkbM family methyltransferase [Lachnospiraceae bacterium]